jgi:hypothetical protein
MAITKAKRSVRRAQLPRRAHRSKLTSNWIRKILRFPQAKGRIIESIEFSTELGYHCISINFTDKTSLNLAIEARFLVETDYSDWKTGNQRLLRRWRPVQNLEFRDTL